MRQLQGVQAVRSLGCCWKLLQEGVGGWEACVISTTVGSTYSMHDTGAADVAHVGLSMCFWLVKQVMMWHSDATRPCCFVLPSCSCPVCSCQKCPQPCPTLPACACCLLLCLYRRLLLHTSLQKPRTMQTQHRPPATRATSAASSNSSSSRRRASSPGTNCAVSGLTHRRRRSVPLKKGSG